MMTKIDQIHGKTEKSRKKEDDREEIIDKVVKVLSIKPWTYFTVKEIIDLGNWHRIKLPSLPKLAYILSSMENEKRIRRNKTFINNKGVNIYKIKGEYA